MGPNWFEMGPKLISVSRQIPNLGANFGIQRFFIRLFSNQFKRVQDQVIMQQNGNFTQVSFFFYWNVFSLALKSDWFQIGTFDLKLISLKSFFRSTNLYKWFKGQFQNIYHRKRRQLSNMIACQLSQIFWQQASSIWTKIELSNLLESKKESN